MIESLEGKRGYPRIKPPYFPAVLGLYMCPTIVNNVETLCHVKHIIAMGGAEYARLGRPNNTGTRIVPPWAVYGLAYVLLLVTHAVVGLLLLPVHAVLVAQRRDRVLPHGLLAAVIVAAVGVPWVAQLSMRTDSETSETAWIPFPSAEDVARALLGVSGVAGLGVLLGSFSASGCCVEAEAAALRSGSHPGRSARSCSRS